MYIHIQVNRVSTQLKIHFYKPVINFGVVVISNALMVLLSPKQKFSQVLVSINPLYLNKPSDDASNPI